MKVLMISGKAGSGKSFLAEHIKEVYEKIYGWRVAIIPFASTLKMVARDLYEWDGSKGPSGRELLQKLGTDIVHSNNQYCWVNCTIEIMLGLSSEYDLFIISDNRFLHEIDQMYDRLQDIADIITVRVEGRTSLVGDSAEHSSETELDNYLFDYWFPNKEHNVTMFFYNLYELVSRLNKDMAVNE